MRKSRSKVHPKYKTKYRVGNWRAYDRGLRRPGDITIWWTPRAITAWRPIPSGLPGGQQRYSHLAIETALALRMVFGLPWRQAEGLLASLLGLMGLDLDVPDHTTLSRRTAGLEVVLKQRRTRGPLHLMVDATGVGLFGQGEWAAAKWGRRGKRGWRKLHLATDSKGFIAAAQLTDSSVADATAFPELLGQVVAPVHRVTADGAYDRRAVYAAVSTLGADSVIPPARTVVVTRAPELAQRDAHVGHIHRVGRRQWRVEVGHHQQARAENSFYRYKRVFGGRLKARTMKRQRNEVVAGCNVLNRFAELGMPESIRIEA